MKKDIFKMFVFGRPIDVLGYIGKNSNVNVSTVSKILDITYSHTHKIINNFEKEGIISHKIVGRNKFVILTEKGIKINKEFKKLMGVLK